MLRRTLPAACGRHAGKRLRHCLDLSSPTPTPFQPTGMGLQLLLSRDAPASAAPVTEVASVVLPLEMVGAVPTPAARPAACPLP